MNETVVNEEVGEVSQKVTPLIFKRRVDKVNVS